MSGPVVRTTVIPCPREVVLLLLSGTAFDLDTVLIETMLSLLSEPVNVLLPGNCLAASDYPDCTTLNNMKV